MDTPKYIVILQCHIVKERCSGFYCEDSFVKRQHAFAEYPVGAELISMVPPHM